MIGRKIGYKPMIVGTKVTRINSEPRKRKRTEEAKKECKEQTFPPSFFNPQYQTEEEHLKRSIQKEYFVKDASSANFHPSI